MILSGCSDYSKSLADPRLNQFLRNFKDNTNLVIGAICTGPIFLAQAGLLDDKKFTCSLFVEALEWFTFIKEENMLYQPIVVDDNIVTAVGFAFNEFAIAVAEKLGFDCPSKIYYGVTEERLKDNSIYKQHLPKEFAEEFRREYAEYIK